MLSPDFSEFVALLAEHEVRYLIVGGYAVAYHGYPRYTGDIDIWLEPSSENAGRVVAALEAFGFGALGLGPETFTEPDSVVQLGYPPNRIDLLTGLEGVSFKTCFENRETAELDGIPVSFIGRDALLTNKRALGRHQDLADVDHLDPRGD
jgi:hypothetical protein